MKEVKLDRPVLICASMSGKFALPFVLRPEAATCTQRLRGFVPIAPAGTSEFSAADYGSCKVSCPVRGASLFLYSLDVSPCHPCSPFVLLLPSLSITLLAWKVVPQIHLKDLKGWPKQMLVFLA